MTDVLIPGDMKEGSLDTRTLELVGVGRRLGKERGGGLCVLLVGEAAGGGVA
ncbi:hypothetical protein TRIP_B330597 [uncultured Desulfatiglans sp.]|nr:hypothetical protein TRIP_B330597 [uncultured Desulfatiglans sp.]